jgi:hypothetical protein
VKQVLRDDPLDFAGLRTADAERGRRVAINDGRDHPDHRGRQDHQARDHRPVRLDRDRLGRDHPDRSRGDLGRNQDGRYQDDRHQDDLGDLYRDPEPIRASRAGHPSQSHGAKHSRTSTSRVRASH